MPSPRSASESESGHQFSPQKRAGKIVCGGHHHIPDWDDHRICARCYESGVCISVKRCSHEDRCTICSTWVEDRWRASRRDTTRRHSKARSCSRSSEGHATQSKRLFFQVTLKSYTPPGPPPHKKSDDNYLQIHKSKFEQSLLFEDVAVKSQALLKKTKIRHRPAKKSKVSMPEIIPLTSSKKSTSVPSVAPKHTWDKRQSRLQQRL